MDEKVRSRKDESRDRECEEVRVGEKKKKTLRKRLRRRKVWE